MLKVVKFGGSSLADEGQYKKVKAIIEGDDARRVIVVSAAGKRSEGDHKITDLLYLCYAHLKYGMEANSIFDAVKSRYLEIEKSLGIDANMEEELSKIESLLQKGIDQNYLVSRGEYLSAKIMSAYLGYPFLDASDAIFFRYDGTPDAERIKEKLSLAYEENLRLVVPGFYGVYPDGAYHLFSRGGSDVTGSLLAQALHADEYENWTDVSGFFVTDPKIVAHPKQIKEISYAELRELSYMGANVLHEDTIFPVQELDIPIHVRNTNRPEDEGTIITASPKDKGQIITGITGRRNYSSITVIKKSRLSKTSAIQKVLEIFARYNVEVEHMPSSIDTFSLIVDHEKYHKHLYEIVAEAKKLEEVEDVIVESDIALIAVVGRNMATKPGMSAKLFSIFGENKINIKVIAQASQELSIIVGVSNIDFERAISAIYSALVR
ncbi:MAG: aspartate kinase [Bacilli bacterium]|nr:aspartate kinase [Bacilli bacterium]